MSDYAMTKKLIRTAFESMPVETRLTFFTALCYTVTLTNNKQKTGQEIYDLTWEMYYAYMHSFGIADIISPLVHALAAKEGELQ